MRRSALLAGGALAAAALALVLVTARGAADEAVAPATPVPDYSRLSGASLYASVEQLKQGWRTDFSRRTVPLRSFQRGGPGRDGIAAVDRPLVVPVSEVDFLEPEEPVYELVVGGVARAYPFGTLVVHEIVNDRVGGVPVAVTFCPLCNTAIAFDRRVDGVPLTFGATGNLRNSDLVMYDRQTESWWQQLGGAALVGRYAGRTLVKLPGRGIPWREFRELHPDGAVATSVDAKGLPYGENPYLGTLDPARPAPFPVANGDDARLPPSERVVLVERGGEAVAVAVSLLEREGDVNVELAGETLRVRLNGRTADVRDEAGRLVVFSEPFWFAVAAFHPGIGLVR